MSNSKISALTSATTPLAGTETLPVVQSSATKQVSVANLTAGRAVQGLSFATTNITVGASAVTAGTDISYSVNSGATQKVYAGYTTGAGRPALTLYSIGSNHDMVFQFTDLCRFYNAAGTTKVSVDHLNSKLNSDYNFVPTVAGNGINFTANTPAAGMTSQLLNWYEEGTWTPAQGSGLTVIGAFSSTGKYTRIGREVIVSGTVTGATSVALAAAGIITTNLPFTVVTSGHGNITNAALTSFAAIICTSTNVTSAGAIAATGTLTFSATYFV